MLGIPLGTWIFVGAIFGALYLYHRSSMSQRVCKDCGFSGKVIKTAKGNLLIEIILWCCFLVPGSIYSIWRVSNRVYCCPECQGQNMIPINSPVGKRLLEAGIKNSELKIASPRD